MESPICWNVSLDPSDEFADEQLLKSLVRKNYLLNLRQNLKKNLEVYKKENPFIEDETINKVAAGCASALEEKSLRKCMMAKLYQASMNKIIKDIKKATNDSKLYEPLKEFSQRNVDKEKSKPSISIGTQTEFEVNIPSLPSVSEIQNSIKEVFPICNRADVEECSNKKKYSVTVNGMLKTFAVKKKMPKSLDERLIDLGLLNGNEHVSCGNVLKIYEQQLQNPAFLEGISLCYSLEQQMCGASPSKKHKVEEKFEQLFGYDHGMEYFGVSQGQKWAICRKRLAKVVVDCLNVYYNDKRILTRELFKGMVRHVCDKIIADSVYPDAEDVKRRIAEFFEKFHIVTCAADFIEFI